MGSISGRPTSDLYSVIVIEERVSGKRLGRPPRPPRYQPGDKVGEWTVLRSVGEDGLPLVSFPTPGQAANNIRGCRVVECRCSCGYEGTVYEIHLFYGKFDPLPPLLKRD